MSEPTQAGAAAATATEDMLELSDILIEEGAEVRIHFGARVGVDKGGRATAYFTAPGETTLSTYYKLLGGIGKRKGSQADATSHIIRTRFSDRIIGLAMPAEITERYGGSWKRYLLENPNGRRFAASLAVQYVNAVDVQADAGSDDQ